MTPHPTRRTTRCTGLAALALALLVTDTAHAARVVVTGAPGAEARTAAAVRVAGGVVERHLPIVDGVAARVPDAALPALRAAPGVRAVVPDRPLAVRAAGEPAVGESSLAVARDAVGASQRGTGGAGVDVAVVDTGVAPLPAFSGRLRAGTDTSADGSDPDRRNLDGYGHGTHLAGIIAGSDPAAGIQGIAPAAGIVDVRVADHDGDTSLSRVIAGLDWVTRHADRDGLRIRVALLALGGPAEGTYRDDPLADAVERTWASGVAVVVAAGNGGAATEALDSPAWDPYVVAAGAEDTAGTGPRDDDHVAPFSSRGSEERHPDVVAPGVGIVSLRVPGSLLDQQFPEARVGTAGFRGSGSSQAAAVTAASLALLSSARPAAGPDELKALLVATAHPLPEADERTQGAGLVDVAAASALPVPADATQRYPRARAGGPWRGKALDLGLTLEPADARWTDPAWRANAWRANSWRANSWRANSWRANSWRANSWRANSWRANAWRAADWDGGA